MTSCFLRHGLWLVLLLGPGLFCASADLRAGEPAIPATEPTAQVAVELTFLKAHPGERDRLVRYIELNWFEMDRIAAAQGLMRDYRVLQTRDDDGPWNVLVEVTYRDERGYAGVAEAFEVIRKAHRNVPVDGKSLRDLGAIVNSQTAYMRLPDPSN